MTHIKELSFFQKFASFYEEDLPNPLALDGELELWHMFWAKNSCEGSSNNVGLTLKAVNFDSFANIKVTLRILATLPLTSCECEHTFSAMRRLKEVQC